MHLKFAINKHLAEYMDTNVWGIVIPQIGDRYILVQGQIIKMEWALVKASVRTYTARIGNIFTGSAEFGRAKLVEDGGIDK